MKISKSILIVVFLSLFVSNTRAQIKVCSTIHGLHKQNPKYTYEDLFEIINKYNPDVIGVEIRELDIDSSFSYLSKNYPYEMYTIKHQYYNKDIHGFDWLGKDIEGQGIPRDYWQQFYFKKLDAELDKDTLVAKKLKLAFDLKKIKLSMLLSCNSEELDDGRYDAVNKAYYLEMERVLRGTKYEKLMKFYRHRNEKIIENIKAIIKNNPGKRVLFLTGADHRSFIVEALAKNCENLF